MRKFNLLLCVLIILPLAVNCQLKIRRLNKRIERWESLNKKGTVEQKAKFARESLVLFLNTVDVQRGRETLVSEAERMRYHQSMSRMQVFLIDYHASRALEFLEQDKDWAKAAAEWAKADSLTRGRIPGAPTIYLMVLLQKGYDYYLKELSVDGFRYQMMERQFPGLMRAFRKMSEYQFRLAKHLESLGEQDEAIEHFLLVSRRDPQNFGEANRRVKHHTGKVIREIYDERYRYNLALEGYNGLRREMYSMVEQQMEGARQSFGDSADLYLPEIVAMMAKQYNETPERVMDVYLITKNELQGTLNQYLSLWRHQILKGQDPIKPVYIE
jgi:tetratricopeptide (TPR) repeat protein